MRLELGKIYIRDVQFGETTKVEQGGSLCQCPGSGFSGAGGLTHSGVQSGAGASRGVLPDHTGQGRVGAARQGIWWWSLLPRRTE